MDERSENVKHSVCLPHTHLLMLVMNPTLPTEPSTLYHLVVSTVTYSAVPYDPMGHREESMRVREMKMRIRSEVRRGERS
jgi:hypothetical protein